MNKMKPVLIFLLSVVITFLLSSIAGTQIVLADIIRFGLEVTLTERVSATIHDIIGLGVTLSLLIGAAFFVAFVLAALCNRFLGGNQTYWYLAAGFTSLPATLVLIKVLTGVTVFAAARGGFGMLIMALCGLSGGWVFARFTQNKGA